MRRLAIISSLLFAAACTGAERQQNDAENGAAVPADVSAGTVNAADNVMGAQDNRASAPPMSGDWFARNDGAGRWAGYGPPFSEAAFSARCEADGQLVFNTTEMPPSGPGRTMMHLSADRFSQSIPAQASENGFPQTVARVDAGTPWLLQLATLTGDLSVRVGDSDALTVPISQPLTSLIRDCAG